MKLTERKEQTYNIPKEGIQAMSEKMTDKQMEVILNLVADKFAGCKDMNEVQIAIEEVRNMAKKEKPTE